MCIGLGRDAALRLGPAKVLSVVSGVRRRRDAEEQESRDRRRIPDTTTWTKPPDKAYGDWFSICRAVGRWSWLIGAVRSGWNGVFFLAVSEEGGDQSDFWGLHGEDRVHLDCAHR